MFSMRFNICFVLALLITCGSVTGQESTPPIPCNVTVPNGVSASVEQLSREVYGNGMLSVWLGWPDGTVVFKPGGAGFVLPDGSLSMKFGWERGVRGALVIDGHRLDAPAPPLRANIPRGYGDIGFQSTALIFPTPGCWEVTGHVGDASLTFVTRIVKSLEGPASRKVAGD
jgi:hypothetical protein